MSGKIPDNINTVNEKKPEEANSQITTTVEKKEENINTVNDVENISPKNEKTDTKEKQNTEKAADNLSDSDEDSEEYFEKVRQMREEREKRNEMNNYNNYNSHVNTSHLIQDKGKKHRLTENTMMRLYLFETQDYIDFQVFYGETIKDLKNKILSAIYNESPYQKFIKTLVNGNEPDAYEIRMADEDEDVVPNYDFPPFEDKLNLLSSKWQTLCFLMKKNYTPNKNITINLGFIANDKVVLKVFNKTDLSNRITSTIIEESTEKTIKQLIDRLERKKFLMSNMRNASYYFICEHINDETKKIADLEDDNELSMEMQLKYLISFEIDVSSIYIKIDFPQKISRCT